MIKNSFRIIFNMVIIGCVIIGLVLTAQEFGLKVTMSTFTNQSNLFCLIVALQTIVFILQKHNLENNAYIFFKGLTLTSILLTGAVYYFVLLPYVKSTNPDHVEPLSSIIQHIVVPLLALGEYLIFQKKGNFKVWYPFAWSSVLFYYLGYTTVYKLLGGVYTFTGEELNFPYFFLDYETHGWQNVILWALLIIVFFIAFSFVLFGFDKVLGRRKISD